LQTGHIEEIGAVKEGEMEGERIQGDASRAAVGSLDSAHKVNQDDERASISGQLHQTE